MNDSKDFQDAESVRSGNSHVTSRPVSFPPHPIPEGMLRHSFVSPRRKEGPPSIWDTQGISGNVFVNPHASSSAPYPQELNQWSASIEEPLHTSTAEKSDRPEQNQDLRCQSGPSAKDSVIFSCIQKVVRMETGEVTSASSEDFLDTWLDEGIGSEVARQPEGEVVQQAKSSQPSQPNPNPDHDRTGRPVVCPQEGAPQTRFSRDSTNFNLEDETNHDRTGRPVVCRDAERGGHWLPNTRIATFCDETSSELSCSWIGQKDRELPSPTCSSTRSATKQSLQPVQCDDKANDTRRGQSRAVWTVRDRPQNAMQRAPIVLESRHRLLHLRASLERKCSQPRRRPMYVGPSFNSKLFH